jgi:tetratricopeptide (TPR) repeat protein
MKGGLFTLILVFTLGMPLAQAEKGAEKPKTDAKTEAPKEDPPQKDAAKKEAAKKDAAKKEAAKKEAAKKEAAKKEEAKKEAAPKDAKPNPKEEKARALFQKGQAEFKERNFKVALDHFQEAYELSQLPALLFNIAQCKAHLGDHDDAIVLYDRYLWEMGGEGDVAMAHQLIQESQLELSKRHDAEGRETLRRQLAVQEDEISALRQEVDEMADRPPRRDWVFWTAVVGGGVLAASGAALVGLSLYCDGQGAPGLMGCLE